MCNLIQGALKPILWKRLIELEKRKKEKAAVEGEEEEGESSSFKRSLFSPLYFLYPKKKLRKSEKQITSLSAAKQNLSKRERKRN